MKRECARRMPVSDGNLPEIENWLEQLTAQKELITELILE